MEDLEIFMCNNFLEMEKEENLNYLYWTLNLKKLLNELTNTNHTVMFVISHVMTPNLDGIKTRPIFMT